MEQKNQTPQAVAQETISQNAVAVERFGQAACDAVLKQVDGFVEAGALVLPPNYHVGNALKSAWLYLQSVETKDRRKAIDVCTKDSIYQCLLSMVTKGEHPSTHCYFIPTGDKLTFWEKYTGVLMRAKRDAGIESVNPQVVWEGDTFVYTVDELGRYQLVKHETSVNNIGKSIVAAYAVVVYKNGEKHLEVMSMEQIRKAWMQGATKGQSGAHVNFTDQMAKRTIIKRACKVSLESSWDGSEDADSMLPPSQAEAERDFANASEAHAVIEPTEKEPTEYAEVIEGNATASGTRHCPV